MKTLLLIAALTAGTAAFAQDTPAQPTPPADSMQTRPGAAPAGAMPSDAPATATMPMPGAPSDADAPTNPGAPMAPNGGAAPMSPPSAGAPMPRGGMANGGMAATPSDKTYPTCTRTMKDNCTNRGGK